MSSKQEIDAAFSEALDEIRATLHRLAEKLGQDAYSYDMRGPMAMAHDMLTDFDPVCRAREEAEEENRRLARAEERAQRLDAPVVI
jgi:hypothetical protein